MTGISGHVVRRKKSETVWVLSGRSNLERSGSEVAAVLLGYRPSIVIKPSLETVTDHQSFMATPGLELRIEQKEE